MRYQSWLILVALIAALVLGAPRRAQAAMPYPELPASARPSAVVTDGRYVVWDEQHQPNRFSRYSLLQVALIDGEQLRKMSVDIQMPFLGPFAPGFALDSGVLVAMSFSDTGSQTGLQMLNITTGERRQIAEGRALHPSVSGDVVTWWELDTAAQVAHLKALNLRGQEPAAELAQQPFDRDHNLRAPKSSAGWIVWPQGRYTNGEASPPCWAIFAVPLGGGAVRAVDEVGCDETGVQLALSGDTLIYTKGDMLQRVNLVSGERSASGPHGSVGLALDGRFAFWPKHDGMLWGYDPVSDSAFPVAKGAESYLVGARNGALAWAERRNGSQFFIRAAPVARALPNGPHSPGDPLLADKAFFYQTQHGVGGSFLTYWNRNGGLPVFGFPLTEEFVQKNASDGKGYTVQYFERQRYEYHPEHRGTPYEVLLGRLGAETLAARGVDWQSLPKASPTTPHYYPQTGQAIDPLFWDYWRTRGLELGDAGVSEREALALWGYPLTGLIDERLPDGSTLKVQWYERARFEYHPQNQPPYNVLLGRLAADTAEGMFK